MTHRTLWLVASSVLFTACGGGSNDGVTPQPAATTPNSGWKLVWRDEFNGDRIDPNKWQHEKNCTGGGNNELQCYTDSSTNSFVQDGQLHIVARKEATRGPAMGDDDPSYDANATNAQRDYSSARLRTKGLGDWRYGRIEVAAQLPQGQGLWPAIWMLPTDWKYGGWPASGEIDIMEAVNLNSGSAPNDVHGTLHYGKFWPENTYTGTNYTVSGNAWEAMHEYAVEWQADEIRWYVDGHHYATQQPATDTRAGWFSYHWADQNTGFSFGEPGAPFDQAFHIILNLAVGGNWPGAPDATSQFPQTLSIDYVRVYQCAPAGNASADGRGCASNVNAAVQPIGSQRPVPRQFSLFDNGLQQLTVSHKGTEYQQSLSLQSDAPAAGDAQTAVVTDADTSVWQIEFLNAGSSLISIDDSPIAGADRGLKLVNMDRYGELKFKLKVLSKAPGTLLKVKIGSGGANTGETTLTLSDQAGWIDVSVPFKHLEKNPAGSSVNYDAVLHPIVIEATGPAKIQLNQVRLICLSDCDLQPITSNQSATL